MVTDYILELYFWNLLLTLWLIGLTTWLAVKSSPKKK